MELIKNITICEVGPRDGLQNEKIILTVDEKVSLINRLIDTGIKVIEVGSFVHPKAVPQMATTDEVFSALEKRAGVQYRALIVNERSVTRAIACGCDKVKLNVSASTGHNMANLNMTPQESVAGFASCVHMAKENSIEISGSISMPFGSPWEGEIPIGDVKKIVDAYISVGIEEISLSDASGFANPKQVYTMCKEMSTAYPNISWWLHFHNTRGMALANILAGMQAGFTQYDASVAGLGGCPFIPEATGNISTEDLVHMCELMGVGTGIDLEELMDIGKWISQRLERRADSYIINAGRNCDLLIKKEENS